MKVHGNTEHGLKRVGDDELFCKVRLQSWFQDHRQRYWVVDESKGGNGRGDRGSSRRHERAAHASAERGDVIREDDMDADREVIDGEIVSDFDNSEDADYEESSKGGVSDDEEAGDSSEEAEESDEDCTVVDDDESSGGSRSVADDDDDEVVTMIRPRRVRKRKIEPAFVDRGGVGIDSEDDEQSSPRLRGVWIQRGAKRQKRIPVFVDSGVVIPSSQDDGMVPPSSPPEIRWFNQRRPEDVEESVSEAETIVEGAVEGEGRDARSEDPFEPQVRYRYSRPGRSMLDLLRDRLEK